MVHGHWSTDKNLTPNHEPPTVNLCGWAKAFFLNSVHKLKERENQENTLHTL
jgi:hypothetical protein